MTLDLSPREQELLSGGGGEAAALGMRVVVAAAELLGAPRLVEIESAHIDGCLYHGDGGVAFAERLVAGAGRVAVPTTLNVGALDLLHPDRVRGSAHHAVMARRQMDAYVALGCAPTWTCAPSQAGHRPAFGAQVAWGESNAIAFCNSVLGARTERYGDFLDACCALTGRAPWYGLHRDENRRATVRIDASRVPRSLAARDVFYPVLGTWLGLEAGEAVAVVDGLPSTVTEDQLKAMGAAAASSGAVALFHVAGVTPEAPDAATALGGRDPERTVVLTADRLRPALDRLSTVGGGGDGAPVEVDAVAVGSPHFSAQEFRALARLLEGRTLRIPFFACTSRAALDAIASEGLDRTLDEAGVTVVVDTCVVVTPILPDGGGVLMTSSGKFAHYGPANTGFESVFGSLEDCVASAEVGAVVRDASVWSW
ncbi:MAG: aconitase X catalytic domain-containing protein [Longimicrobiales bacterium]